MDVNIFKFFMMILKIILGFWSFRNKGKVATKENLAKWVLLALKKANEHEESVINYMYLAFKLDNHEQ